MLFENIDVQNNQRTEAYILNKDKLNNLPKIFADLLLLYLFLVSIGLMSHAFKGFGRGFTETLIQTTSNPFVGLAVGIFVTSIIQSSSTTTSMIVVFASSGIITIPNAIPMVMGANIGTTVTSIIVALGHITRKEEFRKAFAGATINDFFKLIITCILLPLELCFHILEKTATVMANLFNNIGGIKITSPVKAITKPAIHLIDNIVKNSLGLSQKPASVILLIISLIILFLSLFYMVKIMKSLIVGKVDRIMTGKGVIAIFAGLIFTAIIQSSSVTTSLLVPFVAAGILSVENALPITLGADIGTTVTALLAALAGNIAGLIIAFVHVLFNVIGVLIIYPTKPLRAIPIKLAKRLANIAAEKKKYAIIFVLGVYYILPGLLIFIYRLVNK